MQHRPVPGGSGVQDLCARQQGTCASGSLGKGVIFFYRRLRLIVGGLVHSSIIGLKFTVGGKRTTVRPLFWRLESGQVKMCCKIIVSASFRTTTGQSCALQVASKVGRPKAEGASGNWQGELQGASCRRPLPKRAGLMPDMTLHRTSAQVKFQKRGNCPLPKLALATGGVLHEEEFLAQKGS